MKCRFCKGNTVLFIDLGKTPLAGEFLDRGEKSNLYPLKLVRCTKCSLVQLVNPVNRNKLFKSFLSSVSMKDHFRNYASEIIGLFLDNDYIPNYLPKNISIVEIGSNDGVLLNYLKIYAKVLGIEPVKEIASIAKKKGIKTIVDYFSSKLAKKIGKKADIVIANNVLAHIENMDDVMKGINILLKDNGVLIFEIHSLFHLINQNQFDNIYHEHINYYSIASLAPFLKKYDLEIIEVKPIETHGGSMRIYAKKLPKEKIVGFNLNAIQHKKELVSLLKKIKSKGNKIIGFGASGRGNTLLSYCGIDNKILDYILDDSPFRYNKFTPGTLIPIYKPNKDNMIADYVLIIAWNYKLEIMNKFIGIKTSFIVPFPDIEIL